MKQLIINRDTSSIDSKADGYILFDNHVIDKSVLQKIHNNYESIPDASREEFIASFNYVEELSERVAEYYGSRLIQAYEIDLKTLDVRTFFLPWINTFLHCAYYCYQRINTVCVDTAYVVSTGLLPAVRDEYQSIVGINFSLENRAFLCQKIFEGMGGSVVLNSSKLYAVPSMYQDRKPGYMGGLEMQETNGKDVLIVQSRMPVLLEQEIEARCESRVLFKQINYFINRLTDVVISSQVNREFREKWISGFDYKNEFETLLDGLIQTFIPISMCECLLEIYKRARRITESWNFKKIYHGSSMYVELFDMCCAVEKKKKVLIFDVQHALLYFRYSFYAKPEARFYDGLILWNNYYDNSIKGTRVVAGARYCEKGISIIRNGNLILWVSNMPTLYDHTGCNYNNYSYKRISSLMELSTEILDRIMIRIRLLDDGTDYFFREYIQDNFPMVCVETSNDRTMKESFSESSVVVFDYWSGAILEAILYKVPFVIIDAVDFVTENSKNDELFAEMRDVGLYFDSARDLSNHLTRYISSFDEWFFSYKTQRVVCKLKNALALDADANAWSKEFLQ